VGRTRFRRGTTIAGGSTAALEQSLWRWRSIFGAALISSSAMARDASRLLVPLRARCTANLPGGFCPHNYLTIPQRLWAEYSRSGCDSFPSNLIAIPDRHSMALKKQEFYEGAALYLIAKSGNVKSIRYEQPFFLLNGRMAVLLKYSTRGRSPWGFTFTPDEQRGLAARSVKMTTLVGLICGSDGIAAVAYKSFIDVTALTEASVHIACYRAHGEHYEVRGPIGSLDRKVAPSSWRRILDI
jgi:hypothetical protein